MKKLFFAAAIAIVAVGGAYAQQQYSTAPGAGTIFTCDAPSGPTCRVEVGSAYEYPNGIELVLLPETPYNP
jgi:hypothetical protein